jgi:hypothetical protein
VIEPSPRSGGTPRPTVAVGVRESIELLTN